MIIIEFLGAMLLPLLFLIAAVIFTHGRKLRSRIMWTALAVLSSLPIGVMAIFMPTDYMTYDPSYEHAPGIGVGFIPLVLGWLIAMFLWLIGSALALLGLMPLSPRRSN